MPTLNDAFNELQAINGHLQVLHADNGSIIAGQAAIAAAIAASTAAINDVRNSVDAGTAVLNSIAHLQQVTNATLFHMSQQQDAMICALEAISRNTCAIHNETHIQTGRQTVIAAAETALLDITRTRDGQKRPCRLRPERLAEAQVWLDNTRAAWDARLDRLERFLANTANKETKDDT